MTLLWISICGLCGILSRYGIDLVVARNVTAAFPLSTFVINIVGSGVAGGVFTLTTQGRITPQTSTALVVGFCGGFTTFSAYTLQTFLLLDKGNLALALTYVVISPVVGVLAAYAGIVLVRGFA